VNGLSLLALVALVVAIVMAYRVGRVHGRRAGPPPSPLATDWRREASAMSRVPTADVPAEAAAVEPSAAVFPSEAAQDVPDGGNDDGGAARPHATAAASAAIAAASTPATAASAPSPAASASLEPAAVAAEKYRLIVSYEAESARLRQRVADAAAASARLRDLEADRHGLYRELATARTDTARYRQVVVDIENDAPPPILGERGTPDDLKLIVGIGPVLERMLQQLGVATYRQIARWTERDIDEMDARLPEFPGRIRRDTWVTQARELHQSKYGERP